MPPPDDPIDDSATIETGVARLPAATPAPEAFADETATPALSEEDLDERQRLLGTRRKPAGPPLQDPPGFQEEVLVTPADVPPTEIGEALSAEEAGEHLGNEEPEPLESSER